MGFGRETDATLVKPLEGAIIRRYKAHEAMEAGMVVALNSDGGEVAKVDATSTVNWPIGIVLGPNDPAAGDMVDVVVFGPVVAFIDATPGAYYYSGNTAGEPSASAGGKDALIGIAETAKVLFVNCRVIDLS